MISTPVLILAILVFATQGTLLLADEFLFHRRREIPLWERIGHPLDTLTVLIPLLLAVILPFSIPWTGVFIALAIVSCAFVTKDEWVHARLCAPGEQWLHALLFVLHPLLFFAAWKLWEAGERPWLFGQSLLSGIFMIYQTVYWNFRGPPVPEHLERVPRRAVGK